MPKEFIVDASVILKWLNQQNEQSATFAFDILHQAKLKNIFLFTSDLAIHEVMNVLVRRKRIQGRELKEVITVFWQLPLKTLVTERFLNMTSAVIAEQRGVTFYDAVYMGLAFNHGMPLISANPKDHKSSDGVKVISLEQWSEDQYLF